MLVSLNTKKSKTLAVHLGIDGDSRGTIRGDKGREKACEEEAWGTNWLLRRHCRKSIQNKLWYSIKSLKGMCKGYQRQEHPNVAEQGAANGPWDVRNTDLKIPFIKKQIPSLEGEENRFVRSGHTVLCFSSFLILSTSL